MPNAEARKVGWAPLPLGDDELVVAWLGSPMGRRAALFLEARGGIEALTEVSYAEAKRELGRQAALRLLAGAELLRRLRSRPPRLGERISAACDVVAIYRPRLADERREHFFALALDAKNRIRSEVEIAVGSLSSCPIHPREAFRPLVREAASGVVFIHNHPSGDPTPSEEDRELTERLHRAGAILGIRVLDHVIVAAEGAWSFREGRTQPAARP